MEFKTYYPEIEVREINGETDMMSNVRYLKDDKWNVCILRTRFPSSDINRGTKQHNSKCYWTSIFGSDIGIEDDCQLSEKERMEQSFKI